MHTHTHSEHNFEFSLTHTPTHPCSPLYKIMSHGYIAAFNSNFSPFLFFCACTHTHALGRVNYINVNSC